MESLTKINIDGILYSLGESASPLDGILLYSTTPMSGTGYTSNLGFLYGNSLSVYETKKVKVLKSGRYKVVAVAFGFTTNGSNTKHYLVNDTEIGTTSTLVYINDDDYVEGDILYLYSQSTAFQNAAASGCFLCVMRIGDST